MDKCQKMANMYVAMLRAIYNVHQNNHWLTEGDNFYGNHLLFQRIYESAQENADLAAEKFIGNLGRESVNQTLQAELIGKITKKYSEKYTDLLEMSLAIEQDFQKFSDEAYNCFEKEGNLTLGLDDMLCSIASKREESIYLLKSVLKKGTEMKSISRMSKAEALQTLVKVAKLQEKLLNKLAVGEVSEDQFKAKVIENAKRLMPNSTLKDLSNVINNKLKVEILPESKTVTCKFDPLGHQTDEMTRHLNQACVEAARNLGLKVLMGVISF